MATPAATKAKPAAAQPAAASPPPPPRTKRQIADDDRAERQARGFGAFVQRMVRKFAGEKPDHSEEGFIAALKAGIDFVALKDWNTADDMLEELEHRMRLALRVPAGICAEYVARDRATQQPRILVVTDWGLREAVEGQISFRLHYRPERVKPAPQEHRHG